jgi:hypothetical protein
VIDRRMLLLASGAAALASRTFAAAPTIHVAKGTGCECCDQWVAYLRGNGYAVTEETLYGALLMRFKMEHGVPHDAFSCHTGVIEGYVIEGHVPDADIRRLLAERPRRDRTGRARHALRLARHGPGGRAGRLRRPPHRQGRVAAGLRALSGRVVAGLALFA